MGLLSKIKEILIIFAMVILSIVGIIQIVEWMNPDEFISSEEVIVIEDESEEMPILDSICAYIDELRIEHSDIVKAQMIIESGYAKRVKGNNYFGMHVAKQRPTTAINSSGYAEYIHWKDSVLDYALFQSAYCRKMNRNEYLKYISKNYAEDERYVQKIEWVIKNKL